MTASESSSNECDAPLLQEARCANDNGRLAADKVKVLKQRFMLTDKQILTALIPLAAEFSSPDVSNFAVGAAGLGVTGSIYLGANFEFPGSGLNRTVHAEQAVVVNAVTKAEEGLLCLAISAPPCGHCRQFLNELVNSGELEIVLPAQPVRTLPHYLPEAFGPEHLQNPDRIFASEIHSITMPASSTEDEALLSEAARSAQSSYAPYSRAVGGAGIMTDDGQVFAAPYLENVAFNPSLPALQGAIVMAGLAGYKADRIREVVILQARDSVIQHDESARSLLSAMGLNLAVRTIHFGQH